VARINHLRKVFINGQLDRIVINRDSFEVPRSVVKLIHLQSVVEEKDEKDAAEEADCRCYEHGSAFVQVLRLRLHAFVLDEEFP
jgi:hypothetical protein